MFWEQQMRKSHSSSNYFFRKSPSHYHMMLLVMTAHFNKKNLSEELKTKLFKTSRPKSALIINEACEKGFFYLEKTSTDKRKKFIKPSILFISQFNDYLITLKKLSD